MRLVSSIVVMKHVNGGVLVIDSVLQVKHPEGSDPIQLIKAALGEIRANQKEQMNPEGDYWDEVAMNITDIDWSNKQMYVQEASSWYVLDIDERLEQNQPDQYYFYQATPKPYAFVP